MYVKGLIDHNLWSVEDAESGIRVRPAGDVINAVPEAWLGPGLLDLQVNGVNGIDFNHPDLVVEDLLRAADYLDERGVVQFFPTVITNTEERTQSLLATIAAARNRYPHLRAIIPGIHLEGPFISPQDGARGAHPRECVRAPDYELFERFQQAADGCIRLITIAPEWDGAVEFIRRCRVSDVVVALGHTLADGKAITAAVKAGAALSTHLGNGVPLMLPRHPNVIWNQLGEPGLWASFIADGYHLPQNFLRAAIAAKGDRAVLVSDATAFAGRLPGRYRAHIGAEVMLSAEGRLSMAEDERFLAGSAQTLDQNITHLYLQEITSFENAWYMAAAAPRALMGLAMPPVGDWLLYRFVDERLSVQKVARLL